jgi:hypothetical protein
MNIKEFEHAFLFGRNPRGTRLNDVAGTFHPERHQMLRQLPAGSSDQTPAISPVVARKSVIVVDDSGNAWRETVNIGDIIDATFNPIRITNYSLMKRPDSHLGAVCD